MTILIDYTWGDKPTKENFEKHGIVPIQCVDAGMYQRNYHTYTYQGKLYCGTGYAWACTYSPARDHVMLENITGMSQKDIKGIYPRYVYAKEGAA